MVLVDSSVWIEGLRKAGDIAVKRSLEALLDEYEATLCSLVKLDVLGGARKEERKAIGHFFEVMPFLQVEPKDWEQAMLLAWKVRDGGFIVPWSDILIAQVSRRTGTRVFARDKHFDQMASLQLIRLYEPGCGGTFSPV